MQTTSSRLNDCNVAALAINALSGIASDIKGITKANLKVSDNKSRRLAAKRKREDESTEEFGEDKPNRAASPELCESLATAFRRSALGARWGADVGAYLTGGPISDPA